MKTLNLFKIIAPLGVIVGISGLICLSYFVTKHYGALNLHEILQFMPTWIIVFVGAMNVITYLPIFILGFRELKSDGAIGRSENLRTGSVYRYLRNPMYAGVSFTVLGTGLLLGKTQVAIAGLLWLGICYFVSLAEEKSLTKRFGEDYLNYKKSTPRFVPEFEILIKNILKRIKKFAF
jgi:protein-S-isoprenylcysteine O-methyltransferase Ste14